MAAAAAELRQSVMLELKQLRTDGKLTAGETNK